MASDSNNLDDQAFLAFMDDLLKKHGYSRAIEAASLQVDWKPSQRPRPPNDLPVDDVVERLLKRTSSPQIDLARPGLLAILRIDGPYCLVRSHLQECYHPPQELEPVKEAERRAFLTRYLDRIDAALQAVTSLLEVDPYDLGKRQLGYYRLRTFDRLFAYERHQRQLGAEVDPGILPPPSHLWTALVGNQDDLRKSCQYLLRLRRFVADELQCTLPSRPTAKVWKQWFVGRMAHLWQLLTGEEASRDETSMFGSFVELAWHSLGQDMPEQSFVQAIRTRDRSKKAA